MPMINDPRRPLFCMIIIEGLGCPASRIVPVSTSFSLNDIIPTAMIRIANSHSTETTVCKLQLEGKMGEQGCTALKVFLSEEEEQRTKIGDG